MMDESLWFDIDGNPIPVEQAEELLHDLEARRIGSDDVTGPQGEFEVSTVHLVLNHAFWPGAEPALFETAVFGDVKEYHIEYMMRTPTKYAALSCHDQVCAMVRDGTLPLDDMSVIERIVRASLGLN